MQISRLFEIVYLLLDRQKMTAAELALHFEVSKRTILRDIDTLTAAGIPLYTIQGKGGGIAIMDSFVLTKTFLTEDEQNQILFALQGLSATQNTEGEQVLSKLQSLFRRSDTAWIEVDFSRWGSGEQDKRKFEALKTAILSRTAICFDYVSSCGEKSRRTVYPLKLIFKSRAWYLQAFCTEKQDYRSFKINRILELSNTGSRFDGNYRPPRIDDGPPPGDMALIVLEFASRVAYRVYDEFDAGCIESCDNGDLLVSVRMPEDEWLYGYLRSFGKAVRIISPEHLRRRNLDGMD
ncbi:YafY family transcriptional regulator [Clostridiaceae bacterium OttesenSCG-928-D20]|nr:YafY family transcriptional regulator [Clostridiaceae bacterium OttesenSCG-928-D20]